MFPSSNPSFTYINDENPNSGEEHPPSSSSSFLNFPAAFLDDDEVVLLHTTHLLPQRTHMSQDNTRSGGRPEDPGEINAATAAAAAPAPNNTTSAADKETTSRDVAADHHQKESTTPEVPPTTTMKKKKSSDGSGKKSVPRKRTGKKDRHSKIYTAQGPRDRRMRLSLQIARKFFDLQDMLGFDKASKTIEWLFTKSKAAIKELTGNLPQIKHIGGGGGGTGASTETKGTSRSKEISHINGVAPDCGITTNSEPSLPHTTTSPKEKKNRKPRSKSALNPLAKESREKARARARERTREKMIMRSLEKCSEAAANPNNLEQLVVVPSSSSPLETGESSRSREMSSASLEMVEEHSAHSLEHQMATVGIIEKFLGIPSSSSTSSPIFNYIPPNNDNNFPCFPGNWDMDNSTRIHPGCGNYSAMTNMGCPLSTGNFQDQNPTSSVFMTTTNVRQQNPTSIFITTTTSNLGMEESSQFQDHNSCNPLQDANRNHRLC